MAKRTATAKEEGPEVSRQTIYEAIMNVENKVNAIAPLMPKIEELLEMKPRVEAINNRLEKLEIKLFGNGEPSIWEICRKLENSNARMGEKFSDSSRLKWRAILIIGVLVFGIGVAVLVLWTMHVGPAGAFNLIPKL